MPRIYLKQGKGAVTNRWKVKPGSQHVNVGHKVTWSTSTKTKVRLWFPEKKLFGRTHLTIPKGKKRSLIVRTGTPGHYRYAIFCNDQKCFAHGSEPEMIVP